MIAEWKIVYRPTNQCPSRMTPITDWMTINTSVDTLILHLSQGKLQNLIASYSYFHVALHDILQPVDLLQTFDETVRNILFRFTRVQYISKMLGVGIHSHGRDAEINVEKITILDDVCWPTRTRLGPFAGMHDLDI